MFKFVKYNIKMPKEELISKIEEETTNDSDLINIQPVRGIHATVTENNNVALYFHSGGTDFYAGRTCPYFYGKLKETGGGLQLKGVITMSVYLHILVAIALVILLVSEAFAIQSGSYIPLIMFGCIFLLYLTVAIISWLKSSYDIEEISNYLKSLEIA